MEEGHSTMVLNERAINTTDIYRVGLTGPRSPTGLPAFSQPNFRSGGRTSGPAPRQGDYDKRYKGPTPEQRAERLKGVYTTQAELNEVAAGDIGEALRRTLRDHAAVSTHIIGVTYLTSDKPGWWTPYSYAGW